MEASSQRLAQIRRASRQLVRELGFMQPTLAGSGLPASAVHALIEIDLAGPLTAVQLATLLNLEKSSVSRMLAKLIAGGEIVEQASPHDRRIKLLALSERGRKSVAAIHAFGNRQVAEALQRIPPHLGASVLSGLHSYAQALASCRSGGEVLPDEGAGVALHRGYLPGAVGRITQMHASYYARLVGFGEYFECKVASELAAFVPRLEHADNGLWLATMGDEIVGSIALDVTGAAEPNAHLRWFILDDTARGQGAGNQLLGEAIRHCDSRGIPGIYLWTISGLDTARHLYEKAGFQLVEEIQGTQWGKAVTEQKFVRSR
ncbi:helix-turn-helix domain-containing GNAT family N-acetyltransferase [Dechloromonas denitrificans]|uniref:bifunctional helix-turn-helix transcriptional regulator/GNAT family N-acetyltransferase n=1 Tax=Dechloromonas denitrificans TaxID=281362 RepID=UPI001CF8D6A0|nr:helix-turn-helix domain-containing GNAT family N-acetyltransferase [Dechloromonas denitrificans]UCV02553.1 MarR family transcriptional regulator [Dechloromonas denitrificans]